MPRKRLTAANVPSLPYVTNSGKQTLWWHAQCAGLALAVTPSGSRAWYFRERKRNARTFKIGTYPAMSLAAAVRKADELRSEGTALDVNLATVSEAIDRYLATHKLKRGILASECYNQRRACRWLVEQFGRARMATLDTATVAAAFTELHDRPALHDRIRSIGTALWRHHGLRVHPFTFPKRSQPYTKRGLESSDIAALLREVKAWPTFHTRMLLLMAFELAARPGELARVLWADVDLRRKQLTIRKGKSQKDMTYDLSARVVTMLRELKQHRTDGHPYVFEGMRPNRHLQWYADAWQQIRERAGYPGVRFYDVCRHGRATQWLQAGVSLADIAQLLHHSDVGMTSRYLDSTASRRKAALDIAPPGDD